MFTVLPNLFSFIGKKSGLSQNAIINSNLNTAKTWEDVAMGILDNSILLSHSIAVVGISLSTSTYVIRTDMTLMTRYLFLSLVEHAEAQDSVRYITPKCCFPMLRLR